jgi:CHASE1-domain containing sensor protein
LVTSYAERLSRSKDAARFDNAIENAKAAIQNQTEAYIDLLVVARAFLTQSNQITAAEFRNFVDSLNPRTRHSGLLGLGFSKRLAPEETGAFVEDAAGVLSGFQDLAGRHPRAVSFHRLAGTVGPPQSCRHRIVCLADPPSGDGSSAGQRPIASSRIILKPRLVRTTLIGLLIYVPVYSNAMASATIEQRRNALIGFIYSPIRLQNQRIYLGKDNAVDISVVPEGTEAGSGALPQSSLPPAAAAPETPYHRVEEITIAGRKGTRMSCDAQSAVGRERATVPDDGRSRAGLDLDRGTGQAVPLL